MSHHSTVPRDYYEVLGVPNSASETEIMRAVRGLARELHPDVDAHDPEAESKFKEVAEAYEVLSDGDRRATYDRHGHEGLRNGGYDPFAGFSGGGIGDIFQAFFGGDSAFAGGVPQGEDILVEAKIDLLQAAEGTTTEIDYKVTARCERCHGNKAEPGTPIETCTRCEGHGRLRVVQRTPFGQVAREVLCDVCHGDGRTATTPCKECRGNGVNRVEQSVGVEIPAGIADGQRIRLSGRGHEPDGGGQAGDLFVHVTVAEDENFLRDGSDLITVVEIPAPLAALGTKVEIPTLEGETEIEIVAGTQPGETIVLKGLGMPQLRGGRRGELRVVVDVVIPRRLSEEQRELLERLNGTLGEHNLSPESDGILDKLKRLFHQ